MRPIQLWEVVFPKQHLKEVLATIGGSSTDMQDVKKIWINDEKGNDSGCNHCSARMHWFEWMY